MSYLDEIWLTVDLLKRATSHNPKPGVKLRRCDRHLENRYDIITPLQFVLFGWNWVFRCRMKCCWRWYGRNLNRKNNFNMADVCFSKREVVVISQPWIDVIDEIWCADRFWPSGESEVTKYEIGSSIAPPRLTSWESIRRHNSAVGGSIWTSTHKWHDDYSDKVKLETKKRRTINVNNWAKSCSLFVPACKSRMLFLSKSLRFGRSWILNNCIID